MPDLKIRRAEKSDMKGALSLIKELAEYERAPEEVVVTVTDLERDGFGPQPRFSCFVAERENRIIGIALYYIKYSTWKGACVFLEDLIVTQSERRNSVGKLLFEEVLNAAKQMGARRMEWQVLDWNAPAIKFYEKYQPQVLEEWLNYRIVLNENS